MKTVVLTIFGMLAMTVITISSLVFYPFEPFSIANFKTTPDAVCPLEDVGAAANVTIEDGWDLRRLEIISTWEPSGEGAPVGGGIATIPEPGNELERNPKSPVIRPAPQTPGEYRLSSEADMVGTFNEDSPFHGWPKVQIIEYESKTTLQVLPEDDPKCTGEV